MTKKQGKKKMTKKLKKSKKPKSIVISFRLSPVVIAKAIDGLKAYDKTADLGKLSTIIKQVTLHGINYMTGALPWEPSSESQMIVHNLTSQGKQSFSLEESILKSRSETTQETVKTTQQIKPTEIVKPTETFLSQSTKSIVTDFSMPKEEDIKEKQETEKNQPTVRSTFEPTNKGE